MWAEPGPAAATERDRRTTSLLQQAITDEGLLCRSEPRGELSTFWVSTPNGEAPVPRDRAGVPKGGRRITWSVRRDVLWCTSTASCRSARAQSKARTTADRWNLESDSPHRIGFTADGGSVTTRAAVPLALGAEVAELRVLVHVLLTGLLPFHRLLAAELWGVADDSLDEVGR